MIDPENMSILIVDDMKSMRSIIKKILRHLNIGRTIFFAENGAEGMKCLHENAVDLAIVDWKMPVMTGAQMLDAIRSDKNFRDLPVLMVTAECERDIVYQVAEIEVDGYLLKPLTPAMLEEKIFQVVQRVNHPDDATVLVRKVRSLEEAGQLEQAVVCQERAVAMRPNASRLKRNLAILYGKTGKIAAMEKCLVQAVSANLQDAVSRHLLANYYWKKENWSQSVRYDCEVLALTNRFNADAIKKGRQLLSLNQNDLAVTLLSKLIGKLEKNLPIKEEVLDLCMEKKEHRFARSLLLRLLKEFPSNHGLLYKAGLVFEALEEEDTALEYFLAADRNMVQPVNSKLKIARLYFIQKKIIQADEVITEVLRIDPENEQALEMRKSI
ncbi:MAG: response regulator [Desulfobacter sp.]|nr:response regulator [Desulfobacter sp.]WDP87789.1 MAG: response regulator [Desulfobacter sp.]